MKEEVHDAYMQAGSIAARGLRMGLSMIRAGTTYLEVAEFVEAFVVDQGAKPAFPVNISVNDIAAHYSPAHNDASVFQAGDVVKLDVGALVNGYIGDTARTVEVGTNTTQASSSSRCGASPWQRLIESAEDGFNAALAQMHDGTNTMIIGTAVQSAIKAKGFQPIENLTGHSLGQYLLHGPISIPSVPMNYGNIRADQVFAVEPFATSGIGSVVGEKGSHIYGALTLNLNAGLPFSERMAMRLSMYGHASMKEFRKMLARKQVFEYPLFREASGGIVAQFENTVIVTESEPIVTTK